MAGWLVAYDAQPAWLPRWPLSDRLALVCVGSHVEYGQIGFVIRSPAEMLQLGDPTQGDRRLFFKVPKAVLLAPGVCEGLAADSFVPP